MFTEECIVGSKVGLRDVIFPFCVVTVASYLVTFCWEKEKVNRYLINL